VLGESDLQTERDIYDEHVGIGQKIKGEIKVIEGKILHKPELVQQGRAIKHGVVVEK
jgi:hypothetical protein